MAKFYAGQRVRILWSYGWPELAGKEGRIIGPGIVGVGAHEGSRGWRVAPDIWGGAIAPSPGAEGTSFFCPLEDQLEPILPEGAAPSEFANLADLLASLGSEVTA